MEDVTQEAPQEELITRQFEEVKKRYLGLKLEQRGQGLWVIYGQLHFRARDKRATKKEIIEDHIEVELTIPEAYPNTPPSAKETGGRIPENYPHKFVDGRLCLGTSTEVLIIFAEDRTLLHFSEDQLIEYLYGFCYWEKYGEMPWKDRSHGASGIYEFYCERFGFSDPFLILKFLYYLATCKYSGRNKCPCGSGKKILACHKPQLSPFIIKPKPTDYFEDDLYMLIRALEATSPREKYKRLINSVIPDYYLEDLKDRFSAKKVVKQVAKKGKQLAFKL